MAQGESAGLRFLKTVIFQLTQPNENGDLN
jgi:hypothetical protein